jgi:transposase
LVETRFKEIDKVIVSETGLAALRIVWVGIDVSKKSLDAAIWLGGRQYRHIKVKNDSSGIAALLAWAKEISGEGVELRFCMESTGDYYFEAAMSYCELGFQVSVMNPARIKHFGMELGRLTKTDKADSKLIAQFAAERNPCAWLMMNEQKRKLFRLNRRREQLKGLIAMENNRRECPLAIGEDCMKSIKVVLKALAAELRQVEAAIWAVVQADAELREDAELICSLDVLGQACAVTLLTEMPPIDQVAKAPSYAATAGVQSTSKQSGMRQPESSPMSRAGRRVVRRVLYMPTLTAIRKMPEIKDLYERLRNRGRKHRQAMVACMRKLLMIVYGVLKHRKPYQPRVLADNSRGAA